MRAVALHDKSDRVETDDGSVYVGELESVRFRSVSLDTDPAGRIDIEWRHVIGVTSKYPYRVELNGGAQHYGRLAPAHRPGFLRIERNDGPLEVALDDVVSIMPFERGFWKTLDGSIDFGLTYTQASGSFQYNLGVQAERRSRRQYSTLTAQSIFNHREGTGATAQHNLKILLTQITARRWGPFEIGQLQSNPDQGYDVRLLLGGGATRFLIERSVILLALNLGAVYNREDVTDETTVDESAEALVGVSFRRFKRGSHSPEVQLNLVTFTSLDGSRRFRGVFEFGVAWKIVGNFKFAFQVNNSYDSQPPGEDATPNDTTVVTSVGYTF